MIEGIIVSPSGLSVRSQDCERLRIKISDSEKNSGLFIEEIGIFRLTYRKRSKSVLSPTGQS